MNPFAGWSRDLPDPSRELTDNCRDDVFVTVPCKLVVVRGRARVVLIFAAGNHHDVSRTAYGVSRADKEG